MNYIKNTELKNKKNILIRTYLLYIFMCVFAICIIFRICVIQFKEGGKWKEKAAAFTTKIIDTEAVRGNIFDANGSLLATSLPYFEIAVDINLSFITDKKYSNNCDSLCYLLSNLFKDKTEKDYLKLLNTARNENSRYLLLKRNVTYKDLQILKKFPIIREEKGFCLITIQTNRRERPFKMLAGRTIGMSRPGIKPVGLEGAFDSILMGISGKRLMQKIAGNVWKPINNENELEPKNGSDLYTTIDINIQDVAQQALISSLIKNEASHGCAILMEVKTGAIKAIVNLTKNNSDSSIYEESFNYAIGYPTEPGSTFKLASILAVIDEFNVSLEEKINVGNGECMYFDKKVKDSHPPEARVLSLQRVFETSSNVGVSKIITKYYSKTPKQFTNKLNSFHLNEKLGLSIPGEGMGSIPQPGTKYWSGVTLPQLSYGYESLITPLQTLTLYNAIANNGKMVKPLFVKEIKRNGITTQIFDTEILEEQFVKKETVIKAKKLLEGVIINGTGKVIKISAFKFAGKTGTAQIAKIKSKTEKGQSNYGKIGERNYQASFAGYFPVDNPLYSCIVVINSPSKGNISGALVAGPVFKEIAEKVYSGSYNCIKTFKSKTSIFSKNPPLINGKSNELITVAKAFSIPIENYKYDGYVNIINSDTGLIKFSPNNFVSLLKKGVMPNLSGLSAKDAIFLLENSGLSVQIIGFGTVINQSVEPGQKFIKGNRIIITLS